MENFVLPSLDLETQILDAARRTQVLTRQLAESTDAGQALEGAIEEDFAAGAGVEQLAERFGEQYAQAGIGRLALNQQIQGEQESINELLEGHGSFVKMERLDGTSMPTHYRFDNHWNPARRTKVATGWIENVDLAENSIAVGLASVRSTFHTKFAYTPIVGSEGEALVRITG